MSLKNIIITTVIGVLLIGGITAFALKNQPTSSTSNATQSKSSTELAMMKKEEAEKMAMEKAKISSSTSGDAMMQKEGVSSSTSGEVMKKKESISESTMMKKGSYSPYSSDLLKNAETGNVVLFFNASWCPTCQSTVKDINENISKIPSNLTILSTDYDKETSLRQKYGVTTQHTFVKVDKDGNLIKKASSLNTLEAIAKFAN